MLTAGECDYCGREDVLARWADDLLICGICEGIFRSAAEWAKGMLKKRREGAVED